MSSLYVVSTPIGNLADVTYRAITVLGEVDRILAEDTRRTRILLQHYGLKRQLVSAHAHNESARAAQVLEWLDAGETVALVSDAGTPLLSDPGARIVQRVIEAGHRVVPIPGASALLAALVGAGIDPEPFTFFGFTPRSGRAREERLAAIASLGHAAVIYEAPGRLVRLLRELAERCGEARKVVVARELTKVHETFSRGTLSELAAYYEREPARGEVVVVVAGAEVTGSVPGLEAEVLSAAREMLGEGVRPSAAARELSRRHGLPRNRAYEIVHSLVESGEGDRG